MEVGVFSKNYMMAVGIKGLFQTQEESRSAQWFYWMLAGFLISLFVPYPNFINYLFLVGVVGTGWWKALQDRKHASSKRNTGILLMVLFFVWMTGSLVWTENLRHGISVWGMRIPLLLFSLCFCFTTLSKEDRIKLLLLYAHTAFFSCLVCLAYVLRLYWIHGETGYLYNDFMSAAVGKQSIYFANMLNIALFIYVGEIRELVKKGCRFSSISVYLVGLVVMLVVHFFLASRFAMLVLYGVGFLYLAYAIVVGRRWKLALVSGVLALGLGGAVVYFSPKTLNRFKELAYTNYKMEQDGLESHYDMELTPDQWNGANSRLAIWSNGWEVIQSSPILGTGLGDKKEELFAQYERNRFAFALRTSKNLHNNYLDVWMSTGIIGLILFVLGYVFFPIRRVVAEIRKGNGVAEGKEAHDASPEGLVYRGWYHPVALCIIISFTAAMFTEVYLDRSFGCVMLGFFLPFLFMGEVRERKSG